MWDSLQCNWPKFLKIINVMKEIKVGELLKIREE